MCIVKKGWLGQQLVELLKFFPTINFQCKNNSLVHDLKNVGTKVADERNEKVHCTRRGFSMNFILSR